jgi:hypothetical protein
MRTAQSVYRRFVSFEETVASIYLQLASHFSSDRKLGWFWFEMAMEEKQHAGLVQFCLCQDLFAPNLPTDAEIDRMNGLLRDAERRAAEARLNVNEAFSLAIELESSELNAIYDHLTTTVHRSTYLLKRKIATLVHGHIDRLAAAGRAFGVPEKHLKGAERFDRSFAVRKPA